MLRRDRSALAVQAVQVDIIAIRYLREGGSIAGEGEVEVTPM